MLAGYYYGAIHRLQLRREVDVTVGAGIISLITLGFAVSKQVRCTSLLILPTMFTKEGRFWLSTLVYGLLLAGIKTLISTHFSVYLEPTAIASW